MTKYIKLFDGTIAIIDEEENIKPLNEEIKKINENITETKEKIKDFEKLNFLSKHMLIIQPFIVATVGMIGYIFFNLYGLIVILIEGLLTCGTASILWGIAHIITKKKLKLFKEKIADAEFLKREYENEIVKNEKLELQKEKSLNNNSISLVPQNRYEMFLKDNEPSFDVTNSKEEGLVLERKLDKNNHK